MTHTLYVRHSAFMRVVSVVVALAFTLSIAGTGFAAPQVSDSTDEPSVVAVEAPEPATDTPEEAAKDEKEKVPDHSIEAPPTTSDPDSGDEQGDAQVTTEPETGSEEAPAPNGKAPVDEPREEAVTEELAPTQGEADSGKSLGSEPGTESEVKTPKSVTAVKTALPVDTQAVPLPRVGALEVAPYADYSDVDWAAWRVSPSTQIGWAKSNLGEYQEGDYIPVRIVIDNTGGETPVRVPGFETAFDFLFDTHNAIAIDAAKDFRFYATSNGALPTNDWPNAAGSQALSGVSTWVDSGGTYLHVAMATPTTDLVVEVGEYGVIYFQVHLAITQYWNSQDPSHEGAAGYPGSSAQGRFISWNGEGVGDNTISFPVGNVARGGIDGIKFNDLNRDGNQDEGEPGLSGWEFTLTYLGQYGFSETTTSAAGGYFSFEDLPAGSYTLNETSQPGWTNSTPLPMSITLSADEVAEVAVGNYVPDVTKTWSLSIDALPMGAEPFVRYSIDGDPVTTTMLTGSGPYTAEIEVPYGSAISAIAWYASWSGEEILLGTSEQETLTEDKTNSFRYDASVSGRKFDSATQAGLSGWTIILKRVVETGEIVYAQTVTGEGGTYSFASVLPGTYAVYEVQQGGWLNTIAPVGTFVVENGSVITGKDFGNLFVNASIIVEKTGVETAHVGDVIPYTITVTNTGDTLLTDVIVTDALLGLNVNIGSLAPGDGHVINLTYTVLATDPDPLPNTAFAIGTTVLGGTVADDDDHVVDIVHPALVVVKTVAPAAIILGESVVYTYVVSNTGDVELVDIILSDDKLGVVGTVAALPVGGSATFTVTATPTENTTNVVVATGEDESGVEVSDTDDAFVEVALPFTPLPPDMSIVKSADKTTVAPGDTVTYTLVLDNVGEEDAYDVTVTDDFDERYVTVVDAGGGTVSDGKIVWEIAGPLTPGEGPWEIVYTVRIDSDLPESVEHIDNVVVVSAPDDENPDNDRDTWRVTPEPFAPFTEEEKSLPFTGGQWALILLVALSLAAAGETLRRMGRQSVA